MGRYRIIYGSGGRNSEHKEEIIAIFGGWNTLMNIWTAIFKDVLGEVVKLVATRVGYLDQKILNRFAFLEGLLH